MNTDRKGNLRYYSGKYGSGKITGRCEYNGNRIGNAGRKIKVINAWMEQKRLLSIKMAGSENII